MLISPEHSYLGSLGNDRDVLSLHFGRDGSGTPRIDSSLAYKRGQEERHNLYGFRDTRTPEQKRAALEARAMFNRNRGVRGIEGYDAEGNTISAQDIVYGDGTAGSGAASTADVSSPSSEPLSQEAAALAADLQNARSDADRGAVVGVGSTSWLRLEDSDGAIHHIQVSAAA